MPERTSYEPGTPSWVDLGTPDIEAATRFYGALFGWAVEATGTVEETGGYVFFTVDGRKVAGGGPLQSPDQPPSWSTYFATGDADATVAKARDLGAQPLMEPMDVMDAGRLAFLAHPAAGMFGLWQAGDHKGAELVGEPGAVTWNELLTRDPEGAKQFLQALFGLTPVDQDMGGGIKYTILNLGDAGVAGLFPMPQGVPAEAPPSFWQVYFEVADTDATVARAQELGASVMMEATTMESVGRMAALADPHGAAFSIITSVPR
jgi:predicted enzyme related to lactoylglutathione lyase